MKERLRTKWAPLVAAAALIGCGSPPASRPPLAVASRPTVHPAHGAWTKEDKIAAINHAPISPDQKKAEIARVEAGQD